VRSSRRVRAARPVRHRPREPADFQVRSARLYDERGAGIPAAPQSRRSASGGAGRRMGRGTLRLTALLLAPQARRRDSPVVVGSERAPGRGDVPDARARRGHAIGAGPCHHLSRGARRSESRRVDGDVGPEREHRLCARPPRPAIHPTSRSLRGRDACRRRGRASRTAELRR
jgi:hypothetical protein